MFEGAHMREVSNPLTIDDIVVGTQIDVVFNHMITSRGTVTEITGEGDERVLVIAETTRGPEKRPAQEIGLLPHKPPTGNKTYPLGKAPVERRTVVIDGENVEVNIPEDSTWMTTEAAVKMSRMTTPVNRQGTPLIQPSEMPQEPLPYAARLLGF